MYIDGEWVRAEGGGTFGVTNPATGERIGEVADGGAAPFGGMKESGLGREGGREGIAEYLETKLGGFSI